MAEALTGTLVSPPDQGQEETPVPAVWPALAISLPGGKSGTQLQVACAETSPKPSRPTQDSSDGGGLSWIMPVRLTGPALPLCMVGAVLDDTRALFAPVGGTRSIRVDSEGRYEPDTAWPHAICGQIPWRSAGAIAWHNASTSYVMWRDHPEGRVHEDTIPFVASLAFPRPDGSIWWTAFSGGLWSWMPGGSWERLADTPPILSLRNAGDVVQLDPAGVDPSFADRSALTERYVWRPGTTHVTTVPLGPEGPCWSSSAARGWTASAYPHADLVLLQHGAGACHALTCADPFNLAWAGSSLVVSSRHGQLIVFVGLQRWLERDRERDSR